MPAFTIAASYIVAETVGFYVAATWGAAGLAFVTSVVAVSLAVVTSRLINGTGQAGGGTQQDPGVRVQFPPATNNKVPVIYGSVNQKGTVIDARISNENKTMTYVLAISEKTATGDWSVGNIYWNDQKLVFRADTPAVDAYYDGDGNYVPAVPATLNGHIVASSIDQNGLGSSNTNFDGLMRFRVYSGGVGADKQIFPTQASGNTSNARTVIGETDTNYALTDLVFAVVQIDYSSAKGVTGLGQITFEVNNTLKNPGLVWYDYMVSERYGAGISLDQINTATSISSANTLSMYSISNQVPANQYLAGGTTATSQARYEINGVLSTGATVKANLDRINLSSASWTSFDYSEGKWKLIPNRAATSAELTDAFVFNDDVILGEISITATNIEDLYNTLEVEYASRQLRDQNDYFRAAIDPSLMNDIEPNNVLNLRLDMVNNALHAARIGLIELKQSRSDLIISFRADYSAMQCSAGDVIKIDNPVYGFEGELFRITKMREVEDEDSGLQVEITALQYDPDIYTDETLQDSANVEGSGIPVFGGSGTLPAPSAPVISSINSSTKTFNLSTTIDPDSGIVDEIQWFYNTTSTGDFAYLTNEVSPTGNFGAGATVTDLITTLTGSGTYYFKAREGLAGQYGDLSAVSGALTLTGGTDYGHI